MKILVLGGTRFFGIHLVNELLKNGHDVTIATRGTHADPFADKVRRIIFDRSDAESCRKAFENRYYDTVIDQIAYSSNDIARIAKAIACRRYILISSGAVYQWKNSVLFESEFEAEKSMDALRYCEREDTDYAEGKRNCERAVTELMKDKETVFVRYPYVIGTDDYTNRLKFYVEHVIQEKPMHILNPDAKISFIDSHDAGALTALLSDHSYTGALNGASRGSISAAEIIRLIEDKTGKKAIFCESGDEAPYNSELDYVCDVTLAENLGYVFRSLDEMICNLSEAYIREILS